MGKRVPGVAQKSNILEEAESKEYPCDLCGSADAIEVPNVRRYTGGQAIHICKKCGFIYVKMRRPYDVIARVWSHQLFGRGYTASTPLMCARHIYIAEFINQSIGLKGKKVCDVGAGEGQFLRIARDNYGASGFGIEHSPANCRMMRKDGTRCFQGALQDYVSYPHRRKETFDIVTLMWTLECSISCKDMVLMARDLLKNKGHLVIATGSRILVPFAKPLHLYFGRNPVDTHPSRFSVNTLTALLAVCGYSVTHVNPYLNDNLALCVIAQKTNVQKNIRIKGDDYRSVRDFFEQWHRGGRRYVSRRYHPQASAIKMR